MLVVSKSTLTVTAALATGELPPPPPPPVLELPHAARPSAISPTPSPLRKSRYSHSVSSIRKKSVSILSCHRVRWLGPPAPGRPPSRKRDHGWPPAQAPSRQESSRAADHFAPLGVLLHGDLTLREALLQDAQRPDRGGLTSASWMKDLTVHTTTAMTAAQKTIIENPIQIQPSPPPRLLRSTS